MHDRLLHRCGKLLRRLALAAIDQIKIEGWKPRIAHQTNRALDIAAPLRTPEPMRFGVVERLHAQTETLDTVVTQAVAHGSATSIATRRRYVRAAKCACTRVAERAPG